MASTEDDVLSSSISKDVTVQLSLPTPEASAGSIMVSPVANTPEALTPDAPSLMLHLDHSLASESLNESEPLVPEKSTTEANNKQVLPSVTTPSDPTQGVSSSRFVPSLGSWAKPLFFKPPATPPDPSTPRDYDPAIVGNQLAALWPSLNDEILNKQPKSKHPTRSLQLPIEKLPPPELKADGTLRFPWAARLSPQSRNLFRAATPSYRLDGTPEVSIPSKVLKLGPENKDEYVIGKFHKCSLPPGGLVHAVVNRIWGRSCKISCKKLDDSSYMFHIPHQPTRHWVIQRGVWHIDDCLLFVLPWIPEGSFKIPEVSTLPLWVNLENIPDCCYSRLGISHIASGLGEPILTHKPRLDPTNMGEAKVLVEMELDRDFPKLIALDDKQGNIFLVKVVYTWIPTTCERCGSLGHKAKRCLMSSKPPENSGVLASSDSANADVPVVDIDIILQQQDNVASSSPTFQQKDISAQVGPLTATLPSESLNVQNLADLDVLHDPSEMEAINTRSPTDLETDPQTLYVTSDASLACQDTQVTGNTTISSSSQIQEENQTALPNLLKTSSSLVDLQSTPTTTPIMDSFPSNVISNEAQKTSVVDPLTPQASAYGSPCFTALGNVDETDIGPSSSFGLTRGGRETKPPIKYQDLEWNIVRGRGKHGRRGRGSTR